MIRPSPNPATRRQTIEIYRAHREEQLLTVTDEGEDLVDLLPSQSECPETEAHYAGLAELVGDLLASLSPRTRDILIARFGLNDHPPRSIEEVAACRGASRQAISAQWTRTRRVLLEKLRAAGLTETADL